MATTVGLSFKELTVAASAAGPYWGHAVGDLQSGVAVAAGAMTGTLKHVSSGTLAADWGPGNFVALAFSDPDSTAVSHRVGLRPSEGSGLVELDSDMDGVFKVTDKDAQRLVVETVGASGVTRQYYDLSGLVCEGA